MPTYYENNASPNGDLLLAYGYIESYSMPGYPPYEYVRIYYNRQYYTTSYDSSRTQHDSPARYGAYSLDFALNVPLVNGEYLLDQYQLADGRTVKVTYPPPTQTHTKYPQQTTSPLPLSVPTAYQPQSGGAYVPGRLRVVVRGATYPMLECSCDFIPGGASLPVSATYVSYTLLDPGTGDGTQYFEIDHLTSVGSYYLRLKDAAPHTTTAWASLYVGYAPPATCNLVIDPIRSDSNPPSRIGANDGEVFGLLTNLDTNNPSAAVELWQDGQHLAGFDRAIMTNRAATAVYSITGVPPGEYEVRAQQGSCRYPHDNLPAVTVLVDPPDLNIGDQLTFLPWVQPRLTSAATSIGPDARPLVNLKAELRRQTGATATAPATSETLDGLTGEIYGPGDVLGLNERAVLTTMPHPNATGFSPFQLAFIDFKDEDLPWRFSLPVSGSNPPLPWCFLLVLKDEDGSREFTSLPLGGPLPSIRVQAGGPYPSADDAQRHYWAHVQVNASLGTPPTPPAAPQPLTDDNDDITHFLTKVLPDQPDLAYSRILSPRRLQANTRYQAFLLPALEAGRLAGLGLEFGPADLVTALPATPATAPAIDFPVYYQWRFRTGVEADFETLVQGIRPYTVPAAAPVPALAVATGATTRQLPMPTLLGSATTPPGRLAPPLPVASYLYQRLAPGFTGQRPASGRPLVAPPLYGRAYFTTPGLLDPAVPTAQHPDGGVADSWKHQLNLDPRYRALAALGAQVVQENQEDYVTRAWDQVRDILLANEKLRGAQYGLRATAGLRDQHLPLNSLTTTTEPAGGRRVAQRARAASAARTSAAAPAAAATTTTTAPALADYGLHLAGLSLSRVRVSNPAIAEATTPPGQDVPRLTAREAIRRSDVPLAAFSPAFRRLSKPFGKYQVGQAGRPLRPTQPEPEADLDEAATLHQPGTSLRQRDQLLRHLAGGTLTAAPERAGRVRAYQFDDGRVDEFLHGQQTLAPGPNTTLPNGAVLPNDACARFGAAFGQFRALGPQQVVGFRQVQYQRPPLDLDGLKADMVTGTDPVRVVAIRIQTAGGNVPVPPATHPAHGHYRGRDFNASHFYVGDFDEPVTGDFTAADFAAADFRVPVAGGTDDDGTTTTTTTDTHPAGGQAATGPGARVAARLAGAAAATAAATATAATVTTVTVTAAERQTDAQLPAIQQARVFPVFKDAMGEQLRRRRPELLVAGLGDFPLERTACLGTSQAFIEAYLVGLNHALGAELSWRGFPVEPRGTFFQQFWDVREHLNATTATSLPPTAADEAALLDIRPIAEWLGTPLGTNAPAGATGAAANPADRPLRLAVRSELVRRYPTLAFGLQAPDPLDASKPDPDLTHLVVPRQRLNVGPDLAVLSFGSLTTQQVQAGHYFLLLLQRPGQPQFGLDGTLPSGLSNSTDPPSWDDLSWPYLEHELGVGVGQNLTFQATGKPFAPAEATDQTHLTDSSRVAYALFQEPVLAAIPLAGWLA